MNFLQTAWLDIKQRKNLELYLTLMVCILVLVGDVFGLSTIDALSEVILATLTLLVYGTLSTRQSDEQIEKKLDKIASSYSTSQFLKTWNREEIIQQLSTAKEVCWVLVANYFFVSEYYQELTNFIKRGGKLRCIYVNPLEDLVKMAVARDFSSETFEDVQMYVKLTINKLSGIAAFAPSNDSVQVKFLSSLNTSVLYIVKQQDNSDTAFVIVYGFNQPDSSRPSFRVKRIEDKSSFDFFEEAFENMWLSSMCQSINLIK